MVDQVGMHIAQNAVCAVTVKTDIFWPLTAVSVYYFHIEMSNAFICTFSGISDRVQGHFGDKLPL